MGTIVADVKDNLLSTNPEEEVLLKPFLDGFDITWGRRRKGVNTELSVYFLKPFPYIEESFGFSREIMLVYSDYKNIEPRAIQAAEHFITDMPATGRVENLNYFLISENKDVEAWTSKYLSENPESRIIVPFYADDLRNAKGDAYFVRNVLTKHLYGRDLFDYRLPILSDYYFFGRKDIVADIYDSINKNENKGVFGLRKTGKTSVLLKITRQIKENKIGEVFFFDCQSPSIKKLRWYELYEKICKEISEKFAIDFSGKFDEKYAADSFLKFISECKTCGKIILIFDEIENITPISEEQHWKSDFVSFWQTFRSVQTQHRMISTIIVGVNPYPCEMARINNIQNPLFGIVSYRYLKGLGLSDLKIMIHTLGKKMGIKFEEDAYQYVFMRYGGHPYLTRIACSYLNSTLVGLAEKKPITITKELLMKLEELIDAQLFFYSESVISELEHFYNEEYHLLELIASGQKAKFLDEAKNQEYIKHLTEYGLISYDENKMPMISIPIIGRYIGLDLMKREGRKTIYKIIEPNDREIWFINIKRSLLSDIRLLEKNSKIKQMPSLFGANSFPNAEEFSQLSVATDNTSFCAFVNACYRCFVESIDKYGRSIGKNNYFSNEIKNNYPDLWNALYRIRLYRHKCDHLELKDQLHNDFLNFIKTDLEGKRADEIPDVHFFMQQCVLDSLFFSVQIELNKLNK
nr:ATP-binding protein [uncultured Methanoregula sp.]